jgi:hypothetical protein
MGTMHGMEQHAQLGLISRADMIARNIKSALVSSRLRDGSLVPIYRGVYRFRGAPDSFQQRALALAMYGGPGCAISHFAAAFLHGLQGMEQPNTLDLLVPASVQIKPRGARVHRTREPFQIYKIDDLIPTTSLARTLIDLSEHLDLPKLEKVLNSGWRMKPTIGPWLRSELQKLKRTNKRGLDLLIPMVHRLDGGGLDSDLEVDAERMIRDAGLPEPERRVIICDQKGKYVIRADLTWRSAKVVAHLDSYLYHQSEFAMARDAQQRSDLALLGWTQIIVVDKTLKEGRWLEQLKRALRAP